MVSSELVVLLIVCVGINTGTAQQEGELTDNRNIILLWILEYFMLHKVHVFKELQVGAQEQYKKFLPIQNIVKMVDHLLIEHVNISVSMIPTQTVWTLHCSV